MKITDIEFKFGKKYKDNLLFKVWSVSESEIFLINERKDEISEVITTRGIAELEFEEVL